MRRMSELETSTGGERTLAVSAVAAVGEAGTTSDGPVPRSARWRWVVVLGPGILVMLADTDAGSIITAAQSGAQWGYKLLALQLALIPVLYVVQELTLRLGLVTGPSRTGRVCVPSRFASRNASIGLADASSYRWSGENSGAR